MTRRDWLMLMLGFRGAGDSAALDPVRVQKGMFLLAQEGGLPKGETYEFGPYNWGPYSRELRADLNRLVSDGYVNARDVPGYSWKRYALTPAGMDIARHHLHEDVKADTARTVLEIKRRVTGSSFNKLLGDVYAEYPDYAVNSLFRS